MKSGKSCVGSGEGTPEGEEATVENAETGHAKNRRRLSCKEPQRKSKGLLLANYKPLFFLSYF